MELREALVALRAVAAEGLAEDWDRIGLHVSPPLLHDAPVRRALLCIDLTPAVVAEAAGRGCELIVAYHPPIFEPLERLTDETWKGRALLAAVRAGLAVYSPHTALDAATGGVTDWLCDGICEGSEEDDRRPITLTPESTGTGAKLRAIYKLVTFVPESDTDALREALSAAGAGSIGRYDQCSFSSPGEGTFRGGEGTHPTVGEPGRLERVAERRLEMVVSGARLAQAVAALRAAHPYEEPAFDVFRTLIEGEGEGKHKATTGAGRVVTLAEPITGDELVRRVTARLGVTSVEYAPPANGSSGTEATLRRIAVCPGAGGSLFETLGDDEADAYITGEMRHHDVLDLAQRGKAVVLAGHTQTERPYLPRYAQLLREASGDGIDWWVSKADIAASGVVAAEDEDREAAK